MAKVSLRAYNREIEAMIDRNQLDEAVAHCQHILKTFPKHLETYRLLGKAYLEAKRHNEAVDIFSRVLAAEPNDFVAHVGMSIVRDEQNKFDDAIWHMERAFEVQSANPAIQGELQRLYGRRDGVQPPRIRMTRGALAHMYMRGELYPQAISETKGVLEEDPGRSDMQVLLAKAYYRSGQKNDAADAASAVLKRYPFCLDANLVLAEILGADRPDSAQVYRHRAVELDPYAAQADNMFHAAEVSDAAVSLERLDWNGQAGGMSTDWSSARAIGLESGIRDREEQPEWMKTSFPDETPLSAPTFDSEQDASSPPVQPADDIPDFLRAAGWSASSGAFDESRSSAMFDDEPASAAEPIAQGDIPDWVKAMAPQETLQSAEGQDEVLPDWISKIGTDDLPVPSADSSLSGQPDWLSGLEEPSASRASDQQPEWMKSFEQEEQPAPVSDEKLDWLKGSNREEQPVPAADTGDLDWLKGLEQEEQPSPVSDEQPDWLKGSEQEEQPLPAAAAEDLVDWLKGLEQEEQPSPVSDEQPDWLKGSEQEEQPLPAVAAEDLVDWLKGLEQEEQPAPVSDEQPDWMKGSEHEEQPLPASAAGDLDWLKGLEQEEQPTPVSDEKPDWMKGSEQEEQPAPAAATEDLDWLKGLEQEEQPTPVSDEKPDWLKGLELEEQPVSASPDQPDWLIDLEGEEPVTSQPSGGFDFLDELKSETEVSAPSQVSAIKVDTGSLGTSEKEQDDSFAWLENLAAKQGATEGLLTKPEERLEDEPDWIKQAKGLTQPPGEPVVEQPVQESPIPVPAPQPSADVEDVGESGHEIESPAAKQDVTEGLLTKPEEHLEQEPEWLRKLKSSGNALKRKPEKQLPVEEEIIAEPEPVSQLEQQTPVEEETLSEPESVMQLEQQMPVEEETLSEPESVMQLEQQPPVEEEVVTEPEPVSGLEQLPPVEEIVVTEPEPLSAPTASVEELGRSDAERDDSFAWLEALAAKQGATEGLLTKPEERLEQEPEWVKRVKKSTGELQPMPEQQLPVEEAVVAGPEPVSQYEQQPPMDEAVVAEPEPLSTPRAGVEELGRSEAERDDSFAWLEALAAKQGATEGLLTRPEERLEEEPEWVRQAKDAEKEVPAPSMEMPATPELGMAAEETAPTDDVSAWLKNLDEEQAEGEPAPIAEDETTAWLKSLDEPKEEPIAFPSATDDLPDWLQDIGREEAPATESAVPMKEAEVVSEWKSAVEEPVAESTVPAQESASEELPDWLHSLEEEEQPPVIFPVSDDLPAWMRDATGEVVAEPTKIEPTRTSDWAPMDEKKAEEVQSPPPAPQPVPEPRAVPAPKAKKPAKKEAVKPAASPEPYREPITTIRGTGMLTMPVDPILGSARAELSRSNIPGALETYGKLIKKGRFLEDVIHDLREALYRYPVEVSIWQALGDAYMRANQLQDALDAYTKAEELLR